MLHALRPWLVALIVGSLLHLSSGAAVAQQAKPEDLLNDFVFYSNTANPELAAASAEALLESGLSDAELATLLDEVSTISAERFQKAMMFAQRNAMTQSVSMELDRRIETGRRDLARNADRINEAIRMLTTNLRAQRLAEGRLIAAGEYAVPSLLREIATGRDEALKLKCQETLVKIGKQAVTPLAEVVMYLDPVSQRIVCDILGEIGYPHAAPQLLEVSMDESVDGPVRDAARRAFRRVGGMENASLSELYANVGMQYFNEASSLVAWPNEDRNIVWSATPDAGLEATSVPTSIFGEVMAMRRSTHALTIDARNRTALGLFVAANLKRENDLPEGADDPVYGTAPYSPQFYATVFGTQVCLDVLAMAIDGYDTPLVRDALEALAKTTGGSNLFAYGEGRQPLLEAMLYPDRRTQYEAALTLGRALPSQSFSGDFRVVPMLASAVRSSDVNYALVVADDEEDRRVWSQMLGDLGFQIVGQGPTMDAVGPDVAQAVGIDLIIVKRRSVNDARSTVEAIRNGMKTGAAPVVVLAAALDQPELRRELDEDFRVRVALPIAEREAFGALVDALMLKAVGGRMTEAEAEVYAIDAISVLRDIAIAGNSVYKINDAEGSLVDALAAREGGTRLLVADVLAYMDSDKAQRALWDAAFAATDIEQIDLLYRVAESVKRMGDRAEERHISMLIDLVAESDGELAEAAALVHGALNLTDSSAVNLLP